MERQSAQLAARRAETHRGQRTSYRYGPERDSCAAVRRIESLRQRFTAIPSNVNRDTDEYRRLAKDFYTDLRETWERLVEEVLLGGVVERFVSAVRTQTLKDVIVEDDDYRTVYAAMKRVSEFSGHDMAAGRQLPFPDLDDMRRDLDAIGA